MASFSSGLSVGFERSTNSLPLTLRPSTVTGVGLAGVVIESPEFIEVRIPVESAA